MSTQTRPRRTFADQQGREWVIVVDVNHARRVRQRANVDLLKSDAENTLIELGRDPITLCEVLWLLVSEQAKESHVDQAAFWAAMSDDSIEQATWAFMEALIDFFPKRRRDTLRKIVAKLRDVGEKQLEHVEAASAAGRIDQLLDKRLAKALKAFDDELDAIAGDDDDDQAAATGELSTSSPDS